MPYGVKRGMSVPGEFTVADLTMLMLASATGIVMALITDFQQSGSDSALFTISAWVLGLTGIVGIPAMPLWMIFLGLTVIGAGSIFYFQPVTRQGAFAQGFGLLAVLVTALPGDLSSGIEAMGVMDAELEPLEAIDDAPVETITEAKLSNPLNAGTTVQAERPPQIYQAADTRSKPKYNVTLTINFPNGLPADVDTLVRGDRIRGRLHNETTSQTYNLFKTAGGTVTPNGNQLVIRAGVPAELSNGRGRGTRTTRLWVRIETEGYTIYENSYEATLGRAVNWTVDMKPSRTPLFVQRLRKSYWF